MLKYITLFSAVLASTGLIAQGVSNAPYSAEIELSKAKSLWLNSNNAAGLNVTPLINHNDVSLFMNHNEGDFKLKQDASLENTFGFNTNGALNVDGYALWGDFNFRNVTMGGCQYNTILAEPDRVMPYYIADPVVSGWKKQQYEMTAKVATPYIFDRLLLGCTAGYYSSDAAKQNDPRSSNFNYSISVMPAVVYNFTGDHFFGLNGLYVNYYESVSPTNSDLQTDQNVYVMKGLGNYSNGIVGGVGGLSTFYYKMNRVGGGFQYGYNGNVSLLLDLNYNYSVEDVFQTPSKPQHMGTVVQTYCNAAFQLMLDMDRSVNKLSLFTDSRKSDGIEHVQVYDNTYEIQQWVTLASAIKSSYSLKGARADYFYYRKNDRGYSWQAGAGVEYTDSYDVYYMPESKMSARNLYASVNAGYNFAISKSSLLAKIDCGYNANISGEYVYAGQDVESPVITDFYASDLNYKTSDFIKAGLSLKYSLPIAKKYAVYLSAYGAYLKALSSSVDMLRTSVSLGFSF